MSDVKAKVVDYVGIEDFWMCSPQQFTFAKKQTLTK